MLTFRSVFVAGILAPLVAGMLVAGCTAHANDHTEVPAIAALFADYSSEGNPGVSVMVIQRGEIVAEYVQGDADIGAGIALSGEHVLNIGSISKHFTLAGILALEREGALSMKDDIRRYIPELPDYGQTITLEHLAQHTSGLRSPQWTALMGDWLQTDHRTHEQMLGLTLRQIAPDFEPGTHYAYSNAGTVLLAEVVARVSGVPFPDFMRQTFYEPLGMASTFNRGEEALIISKEAHSYYWEDGVLKKALNPSSVQGYTNVYTTAADLAKWVGQFPQNPDQGDHWLGPLFSPTVLNTGERLNHLMGFFSTPHRGYRHVQHTGGDRGYISYLGWFPDEDLFVFVLFNFEGMNVYETGLRIADLFLPAEDGPLSAPPDADTTSETGALEYVADPDQLSRYVGTYQSKSDAFERSIALEDGALFYVRSPESRSRLIPVSDTDFLMEGAGPDIRVSFRGDEMWFADLYERSGFVRKAPTEISGEALKAYGGVYYSPESGASYALYVCNQTLVLTHAKRDDMRLTALRDDVFRTDQWFLRTLSFQRDGSGRVAGFYAANQGVDGVWFARIGPIPAPSAERAQARACAGLNLTE